MTWHPFTCLKRWIYDVCCKTITITLGQAITLERKKRFQKHFSVFFFPKKWYTFLVIPPSTNATGSVVRFYNAFIVTSSKWLSGDIFRGTLQGELAVLFPQRMKRSVVQPQKVFSFTNQNSNCMIEYMCLGICDSHKLSLCIFKMPPQNKRMSLFNTAAAESL